jgi:hypothetical protein
MKKLLFAPLAALFLSFGAHAQSSIHTLTIAETPRSDSQQLSDAVIGVEVRRSPGAVIATDALYGGIAGLAVGGGVALLTDSSNWGRDLAIGAGAGLIVGAVFGAVDAASYSDRAPVGFGNSYKMMSGHF